MEIERKFVLDGPPAELERHPRKRIEQGYVAIDPNGTEVRVRRKGDAYLQTVKSGGGLVRTEVEFELDAERFDALWPLTEGRRVVKTRFEVPLGDGLTAEVDVYEDALAGLVTAEVEFASEAASDGFTPPAWIGREVTGDSRYANRELAVAGIP